MSDTPKDAYSDAQEHRERFAREVWNRLRTYRPADLKALREEADGDVFNFRQLVKSEYRRLNQEP